MGNLDYLSIGLLIFVSYLMIYSLINRICDCIERCSRSKHQINNVVNNSFDSQSNEG